MCEFKVTITLKIRCFVMNKYQVPKLFHKLVIITYRITRFHGLRFTDGTNILTIATGRDGQFN